MFSVTRKYHFHAAHRNLELVGSKCESLHGHTYGIEIELAFNREVGKSVTMPFAKIDEYFDPFISLMDHSVLLSHKDPLNKLFLGMKGMRVYVLPFETSAENIAQYFYDLAVKADLPVTEVRVKETSSSIVAYRG